VAPDDGWKLTVEIGFQPAEPGAADGAEPSELHQAGDPAEAVERLRAVLRQHAERLGADPAMPAPVTEAQLAAAERHPGRPLPADLRALYVEADGDGDREALAGYCWLTLDGSLAEHDDCIGVPGLAGGSAGAR